MTIQESLEKTARLIEAIDEHSTRQNQKTKLALETAEAEFDPTNLRCLKEAIHMVSSAKRQMVKATIAGGTVLDISVPHKANVGLVLGMKQDPDPHNVANGEQVVSMKGRADVRFTSGDAFLLTQPVTSKL